MEMIYLSKAQLYFDDLILQGYPENEALDYTQKYYPGFFLANMDEQNGEFLQESEFESNIQTSPYIPSNVDESFTDKYGPKAKIVVESIRNS